MEVVLEKLFSEVDVRKNTFITLLRDAVAIPSVSALPEHRNDVFKMIQWTQEKLVKLGVKYKQIPNGKQILPDGSPLDLPPVLFGTLGTDPTKKTLLIYGHLDVQPASKEDGWDTEPFELVEKDGKLFGRGSTDDKGPVLAWMCAIEVMQSLGVEIPVNLKFVFEGMEESGSEGLDDILLKHKDTFLADVDFTCISDNYWLGKTKPCITYGLRGLCYYSVEVTSIKQDLHSGLYGGTVHEPMNDLVWILSQLTDVNGKIMINGIDNLVAILTDDERRLYDNIEFCMEDYCKDIGAEKLTTDCPKEVLMRRWRYPSLSIHGIEGAFAGKGAKTVIPCKVIGKFSIRLVPNMEAEEVNRLVIDHTNKLWASRGSPNKFRTIPVQSGPFWVSDFKHEHYQAGARAIKKVFNVDPDFTREGGSIPVTLTFQNITGKNVMLLPIGASDDMAHSQNEKLNVDNYITGVKLFIAYLQECGNL